MLFGQAVDFSSDKFGSAPSGVALEFLYTNLNLKADKLARKAKSCYTGVALVCV